MKLFKKRGKWWVDFTANGKRHRQTTGTSNRKMAEAWMSNIQTAARMPNFESAVEVLKMLYAQPTEGRIPLGCIWETYERVARATGKELGDEAVRKRRNAIARFEAWMAEKRPTVRTVEGVTGPVAAGFAEYLTTVRRRDGAAIRTKTRRNILGDLSATWNLLAKASSGVTNPWEHLMPPDVDGERGNAFTPAQEADVLAAAKAVGKDWWPICQVMRMTGLRYGDVATMTWDEIGSDGMIHVEPNKNVTHNRRNRVRRITVDLPITDALRDVLDTVIRTGPYLFPMHHEMYRQWGNKHRNLRFQEVLDAAGIVGSGYSVHSWRHTAATRLAEHGVDIETRMRILGHTEDVTARRYDHDAHVAEKRAALEKLGS